MKPILIVGASGHSSVVIDIIEKEGRHSIVGLVDKNMEIGSTLFGYPILGKEEEDLPALAARHRIEGGLVAIGDNWVRAQVVQRIHAVCPELEFVAAIHPQSSIARGVSTGPGTVVMAGAILNTNARVGAHCIVNTNASLDHDGVMRDYSSLAPGAVAGGNVTIGCYSAVSLGAHIVHRRCIGDHSIVGAGATVLDDLPDYVVAYGTPARVIRSREQGDKYL